MLFKEQFYWKGCYITNFKVLYPELKILYKKSFKSLEVTEIILKFAINSVSSFVWACGLFTGKDVYGTLSLSLESRKFEYTQKENGNWKRPRRVYYILTCRTYYCFL